MLTFASLREMRSGIVCTTVVTLKSETQNLKNILRHISDQVLGKCNLLLTVHKHIVNYLFLYILKKF